MTFIHLCVWWYGWYEGPENEARSIERCDLSIGLMWTQEDAENEARAIELGLHLMPINSIGYGGV